jgi:hypothetical protein
MLIVSGMTAIAPVPYRPYGVMIVTPIPLTDGNCLFMPSFKQPTFQERTALAAKAKQAALEKLRAKPPVDEVMLAERRAAAQAREAAAKIAREEKLAARVLEKAQKEAEKAERVAATPVPKVLSDEEQKAIRDAKYAARKNRVGKPKR